MNKAFFKAELKAVDGDQRLIEGWATKPEEDRQGDIVMPRGASYSLPLPFLLDHDHRLAVGEVDRIEVRNEGIKFWAHIKKIDEPGEAKELCDKAWSLIKNQLRRYVSIGFRPLDYEPLPKGGLRFTSWEWLELSAVVVPAQPGASITGAKGAPRLTPDSIRVIRTDPTRQPRQLPSSLSAQEWAEIHALERAFGR